MKEIKLENKNTIVNFSNSILKHFNAPLFHDSIPEIDSLLKNHKKVAVLLFDGSGKNILRNNLSDNSFIRKHYIHSMTATFPPTTVASTTALLSAKYPIETGWFGWRQYFKEYHCPVLLFRNTNADTKVLLKEESIMFGECPYDTLFSLINKYSPKTKTIDIKKYPADKNGPKALSESYDLVNNGLKQNKECFLYFYWADPDETVHLTGIDSLETKSVLKNIDCFVEQIVKENPDTLFFTIADHGLVNVNFLHVYEHKDFVDTFLVEPTVEGRATNFFIKKEKKKEFEKLFRLYYGDKFILLTMEEVLNKHLFGEGLLKENARQFLGDYLAIAISKYSFELDKEFDPNSPIKAHHAGYTEEEMLIDVSCYNS